VVARVARSKKLEKIVRAYGSAREALGLNGRFLLSQVSTCSPLLPAAACAWAGAARPAGLAGRHLHAAGA
jgi:hypothetical protein